MTLDEATRVIDRLVIDLARTTGQSDAVVRLGYGLGPVAADDDAVRAGRAA